MARLRAGDLRERVVFLASTRVADRGFASESYSTVCSVWAAVRLKGGSNENTQDRRAAKLAIELDLRYRSDITDEMRIVWRGKTFEITAPIQLVPIEGRMTIAALEDESLSLAVDHITVSPESVLLFAGDTQQLTAICFDENGNVAPGIVIWTSSDPTIATVDLTSGLVTGIALGTCTITATCEGKSATVAVQTLAAFASALDVVFATDYDFPNTQPAGLTFIPEGSSDRFMYDAGNGQYNLSRRVTQAPSDWATGPVNFNLVFGNGWIDGGDLGPDATHHGLRWHRFTGGASMFTFSQILSSYDLEYRDELPPHCFAGFWIRGVEGAQVVITLHPANDGGGTQIAATKTITLHAVEQYVALEGDIPGVNNAAMLAGLNLCIWINPLNNTEAAKFNGGGHLELLACVPYFGPAPSDLLTNPAALDRFRLLKPTTAAVAQGVAFGGMSIPVHPTRGLFVAQSAKNHLADGCDVGQGSQWTKAGGWVVTDSGTVGPEPYLQPSHNGYTWKRNVVPPGATLVLAAGVTLEQGDSNLGGACQDTFAWLHYLLMQDGTNALPLDSDLQFEINGTAVYTAPGKQWSKMKSDSTVWTYRGRPYIPATNNATTFTVTVRNVSTKTLQFLSARIGLEREAYLATTVNDVHSRDVGGYAMHAIQRPFTVTGLSAQPIQTLVRNRFDDASQFADFIGGVGILMRTFVDAWDVPTLAAVRNPNYQTGRKLCDQGTYANDDTSFEVVIGENDAAGSGNISLHALCYPGTPLGGRRNHQVTIPLSDTAIIRGAVNDFAFIIYQDVILGIRLPDGTWYYRSDTTSGGTWRKIVGGVDQTAPDVSEIYQDGTLWAVTHGWYTLTDRDFAAPFNGWLTAMNATKIAGGPSRIQVDYLFGRWTRQGVGVAA